MGDKAQRRMIVRSNFLPKVPPSNTTGGMKSENHTMKDISFGGNATTSKNTFGSTITITEQQQQQQAPQHQKTQSNSCISSLQSYVN